MSDTSRTLWLAAAWTVAAALVGQAAGLLPAGAVALAAAVWTAWRRRAGPWIWALPAALATGVAAPAVTWPRPGPVRIDGTIHAPVRFDAVLRSYSCRLRSGGQTLFLVVTQASAERRLLPGDRVRGPARLSDQPERRRRGLPPRLTVCRDALLVDAGPPGGSRLATACRLAMQRQILAHVGGEAGLLLCHLALGSGPRLPDDLGSAHRATGLTHLLAVSGAHLTMLAWMLGCAFALTTRRTPLGSPWFRRGCGVVLLLYGGITGMEPPVFRAVVAAFIFLLAQGRGRRVPATAVLTLPAMLTALLAPEALFGVSFNLSYAAVVGLFLSGALTGRTTFQRFVRGPLLCSVWATLCTMPLTLWYFGRIAPWSIAATPLLSPLVALMLCLALLVAILAVPLPAVAWLLSWPLSAITSLYSGAVRALDQLPWAPVAAPLQPGLLVLAAAAVPGVLALLWWRDRRGVAVLCLGLSLPHFLSVGTTPQAGLRLLDVGHGHAALLRLPDRTSVLVDCGSLGRPAHAARRVTDGLLPQRHLDWLVVTHGDADHVGGIVPLLDRVVVRQALLPDDMRGTDGAAALGAQGASVRYLVAGARIRLAPGLLVHRPSLAGNRNDQSAWVHADCGSFTVTLSGDALADGVRALLASDLAAECDVLVLPHHGRPHAAVPDLLARLRPQLALVSSRARDGVTAQGLVARRAGFQVLHTGVVGWIEVRATAPPTVITEFPTAARAAPAVTAVGP